MAAYLLHQTVKSCCVAWASIDTAAFFVSQASGISHDNTVESCYGKLRLATDGRSDLRRRCDVDDGREIQKSGSW